MKVIVAAMPKTGTKTMSAALKILGYTKHDFLEQACYHNQEWKEILATGGNPKLFREMYKDVDAVVDIPASIFWEQIHQAFPNAKIVLLTRDEDSWYESALVQLREFNAWSLFKLATIFTPTGRMFNTHILKSFTLAFGSTLTSSWRTLYPNEMGSRLKYRQHNCYVLQNAPKDKLLVMKIREGWGPLCNFLEVEEPDVDFPHKNKGGTALEEAAAENPIMQRMIKELFVVFAIIFIFAAFCAYCLILQFS